MNATDALWQRLLDEACENWKTRPAAELKVLPQITYHRAKSGSGEIEYALWHENPNEGYCNLELHCFVLQAQRNLFPFGCRNHLAGFALDENDAVIPIAEEVLQRYD